MGVHLIEPFRALISITTMIDVNQLRVASPCSQSWRHMTGDDKKRFCERCDTHVYDISSMTEDEAQTLMQSGKRVCVRLYRRRDGTVMTADCPVGRLAKWRMRSVWAGAWSAAVGVMMCLGVGMMRWCQSAIIEYRDKQVVIFTDDNGACHGMNEGVVIGVVERPSPPPRGMYHDTLIPEIPNISGEWPCPECRSLDECEPGCTLNQT